MRLKTKFQDEEFELGEVVDAKITDLSCYENDKRSKITVSVRKGGEHTFFYSSIAELIEMWEDAPETREQKTVWWLDNEGNAHHVSRIYDDCFQKNKEIGNYFKSEDEAEKAVEKLKAWKRLKDKGFEFCCEIEYEGLCGNGFHIPLNAIMPPEAYTDEEVSKDLELLFGGEE